MSQEMQQMRIGYAERDDATEQLSEHFAAGRLDLGEFEQRSGEVLRAKTRSELQIVFSDLPVHRRPGRTVKRPSQRSTKIIASTVSAGAAIVAALLVSASNPEVPSEPGASDGGAWVMCDPGEESC